MNKIVSTLVASVLVTTNLFVFPAFAASDEKKDKGIEVKKFYVDEHKKLPTYVSGKLSLPSKDIPANIVKNYLNSSTGSKDSCKIHKVFRNDQGETVVKSQQIYNGIRIKGASQSYIVGKDGVIKTVSGLNIPKVKERVKGSFRISEEDAKNVLKQDIKREFKASDSISVEKIIVPNDNDLQYAYSVKASFVAPCIESWEYTINAESGKIIEKEDCLRYGNVDLTGTGYFGEQRNLKGYEGTIPDKNIIPANPYSLADMTRQAPAGAASRSFKILTYNFLPNTNVDDISNIEQVRSIASDADTNFNNNDQSYSVDAHYNAGIVYEFYKNKFARYSYDNLGSDIDISCHALFEKKDGSLTPNNACFDSGTKKFYFGDGDGVEFGSLTSEAETLGHEFTHGVVDKESGLEYCYQSGAINEGLADFMGEAIEAYEKNSEPDWKKMGLAYTPGTPGDAYLDFKNPQLDDYPDHMDNIYKGSEDLLGVHINAAILTKAFSLMGDGGSFHNVNVNAIGTDKLAKIMYKVIMEYLTNYTNFIEFAEASIDAAGKMYGENSPEYNSVKSGFQAVGILNGVSQWTRIGQSQHKFSPDTPAYCQIENKVYFMGGLGDDGISCTKDLWEYDIATNQWSEKADMLAPRAYPEAVAINGKIYLFYGQDINEDTTIPYQTAIDVYDPSTDQWSTVSHTPSNELVPYAQYNAGTVFYKPIVSELYSRLVEVKTGSIAAGGSIEIKLQGSNNNQTFVDVGNPGNITSSDAVSQVKLPNSGSNYIYYRVVITVKDTQCTFGAVNPHYRNGRSIIAYNNKVYIVGGTDVVGNKSIATMDVYDPATNQWTTGLNGLYNLSSPSLAVVTVNNTPKIYAFFGVKSGTNTNNEIWAYDFGNNEWSYVGMSPVKVNAPAVAVYNGKVHFVGGGKYINAGLPINAPGNAATIIYDVETSTWSTDKIPGLPGLTGICPVYNGKLYFMGTSNLFLLDTAPIMVEVYDPLKVNAFDNNNSIMVQWSKYGDTTNSVLTIDNQNVYSGTDTSYPYTMFQNTNKKHTMSVTQTHPIYGTITSKPISGAYVMVGDVDQDNQITAIDVAAIRQYILGSTTLTAMKKAAADINGDSSVDSLDYAALKGYLLNGNSNYNIGGIKYIIFGDVNRDGNIDSDDKSVIAGVLNGDIVLNFDQAIAADVDGDGSITSNDILCFENYILSNNYTFPVATI